MAPEQGPAGLAPPSPGRQLQRQQRILVIIIITIRLLELQRFNNGRRDDERDERGWWQHQRDERD